MNSVDVIVPCYRYGHFLRQCVESILSQSVSEVRVLIIDDASPDNTAEVGCALAREDCRVSLIRHEINKGHIQTYNEGIAWASADYMLILSADDYLLPGALARSTELMEQNPQIGFTFGNVMEQFAGCPGKVVHSKIPIGGTPGWSIFKGRDFVELSGPENIVRTPTAVVRTKLQKVLGGYRADLPHTGDMEMWLRFAAHASVGFIDSCQAVYRRHGANMSLGYELEGWLPDLIQRKAALDCFFSSVNNQPEIGSLQTKTFRSLARIATGYASSAFNGEREELSIRLSEFAASVYPGIRTSVQWLKLLCKRRVGVKAWRVVRPAVARIRKNRISIHPVTE